MAMASLGGCFVSSSLAESRWITQHSPSAMYSVTVPQSCLGVCFLMWASLMPGRYDASTADAGWPCRGGHVFLCIARASLTYARWSPFPCCLLCSRYARRHNAAALHWPPHQTPARLGRGQAPMWASRSHNYATHRVRYYETPYLHSRLDDGAVSHSRCGGMRPWRLYAVARPGSFCQEFL